MSKVVELIKSRELEELREKIFLLDKLRFVLKDGNFKSQVCCELVKSLSELNIKTQEIEQC